MEALRGLAMLTRDGTSLALGERLDEGVLTLRFKCPKLGWFEDSGNIAVAGKGKLVPKIRKK